MKSSISYAAAVLMVLSFDANANLPNDMPQAWIICDRQLSASLTFEDGLSNDMPALSRFSGEVFLSPEGREAEKFRARGWLVTAVFSDPAYWFITILGSNSFEGLQLTQGDSRFNSAFGELLTSSGKELTLTNCWIKLDRNDRHSPGGDSRYPR